MSTWECCLWAGGVVGTIILEEPSTVFWGHRHSSPGAGDSGWAVGGSLDTFSFSGRHRTSWVSCTRGVLLELIRLFRFVVFGESTFWNENRASENLKQDHLGQENLGCCQMASCHGWDNASHFTHLTRKVWDFPEHLSAQIILDSNNQLPWVKYCITLASTLTGKFCRSFRTFFSTINYEFKWSAAMGGKMHQTSGILDERFEVFSIFFSQY